LQEHSTRLYPQRNCLDRETAPRMWTENATWFSNQEGKKRIQVGQFADLIVPDRDYFSCADDEIADITSDPPSSAERSCTGTGEFAAPDEGGPPPAMPDWSPVHTFGGYAAGLTGARTGGASAPSRRVLRVRERVRHSWPPSCRRLVNQLPLSDFKSFCGALGCTCWVV
jgi:Amidohydrolase family